MTNMISTLGCLLLFIHTVLGYGNSNVISKLRKEWDVDLKNSLQETNVKIFPVYSTTLLKTKRNSLSLYPPPANPRPASPPPANPRPASPPPANPRSANPRPANPRPASPRPASPPPANPRPASPPPRPPTPQPEFSALSKARGAPSSFRKGTRYVFTSQDASTSGGITQCMPGVGHSTVIIAKYDDSNNQKRFIDIIWYDLVKVDRKSSGGSSTGHISGDEIEIRGPRGWRLREARFNYKGEAKKSNDEIRAEAKKYQDAHKSYALFKTDCQRFANELSKIIT